MLFAHLAISGWHLALGEETVHELPPYTVTGTRIQGIDLETTVPIDRLLPVFFESTGYSRFDDSIRSLPMVGPSFNGVDESTQFIQGASTANLRTMGDAHLVLIDGLRIPQHDGGGGLDTPYNLNVVPSSAIGQVDILLDGASAIYGSDAISGVINIHTIRDFEGTEVAFGAGLAEGTDSWEYQASLRHGRRLDEHSSVVLSLDYYNRNNLAAREHAFMASTDFRDRGGFNRSSSLTYPANFVIPDPNHPLAGSYATFAKPTGSPAIGDISPSPGNYFFSDGGFNYNAWQDYSGDLEQLGAFLRYEQQLTAQVSAFLDLFYRNSQSIITSAPTPFNLSLDNVSGLPAVNPYNPFGESRTDGGVPLDITIARGRLVEAGPRIYDVTTKCPRVVAGLEGEVSGNWSWKGAALWSSSETSQDANNSIHATRFEEALSGVDLDGNGTLSGDEFLNPFGPNNPGLFDYLLIQPNNRGESRLWMIDAHGSGILWENDTYQMKGALGGEYRDESLKYDQDPYRKDGLILGSAQAPDISGGRDVYATYGELFLSWARKVELQIAGRFENYSDFGEVTTPKFSASVRLLREVLIRGSYGEGFTAPPLPYLYKSRDEIYTSADWLMDLKTNQPVGGFKLVRGGNPGLEPSTSINKGIGAVLEPFTRLNSNDGFSGNLKNLTLGVDYLKIDYANQIESPSIEWLVTNEDQLADKFPGQDIRIERGTPPVGQEFGAITRIYSVFINRPNLEHEDVCAWLDWPFSAGKLGNFALRWKYFYEISNKWDGEELSGMPWRGPRRRWNAQLDWSRGNWSTAWYVQYLVSVLPNPFYPSFPTSGSMLRINAQISYSGLWNTNFTIGVRNLRNRDPSFDSFGVYGFNTAYPGGKRFWYIRAQRSW